MAAMQDPAVGGERLTALSTTEEEGPPDSKNESSARTTSPLELQSHGNQCDIQKVEYMCVEWVESKARPTKTFEWILMGHCNRCAIMQVSERRLNPPFDEELGCYSSAPVVSMNCLMDVLSELPAD